MHAGCSFTGKPFPQGFNGVRKNKVTFAHIVIFGMVLTMIILNIVIGKTVDVH